MSQHKPAPKRTLFNYEPRQVAAALKDIRLNSMKVSTAAKLHNVPRSTLRHKLDGSAPDSSGKVGKDPVLGQEVEEHLAEWIKTTARMGFPVCKEGLIYSVKQLVQEAQLSTPFVDNKPGAKWFQLFMKRHPDLSRKHSEYINKARSLITEDKIRGWFQETAGLLGEDIHILQSPERIWNMDETSMYLCPKGGLVLAEKGVPVYDTSANSDKDNITTLFAVNANGEIAPPLTLYKYERLPVTLAKSAPAGWSLGKSPKGWMTSENFYEYFSNVFLPYLKDSNVKLPVIVFLDGHSSHLSLPLSRFCMENGMILVCLYPNTTHILQPLDVSFFFPLKAKWKKAVRMFRYHHDRELKKGDIPNVLNKMTIEDPTFKESIKNGFRSCGLFPFNADNVDYKKCTQKKAQEQEASAEISLQTDRTTHLSYLESKMDPDVLLNFEELIVPDTDKSLFDVWMKFKNDAFENVDSIPLSLVNSDLGNKMDNDPMIFDFPEFEVGSQEREEEEPEREFDGETQEKEEQKPEREELLINLTPNDPIYDQPNPISIDDQVVITPKRKVVEILKEIIYYPNKSEDHSIKKRKRDIMPSVLTSSKWLEIAEAKEKEKEDEKLRKMERKMIRDSNKENGIVKRRGACKKITNAKKDKRTGEEKESYHHEDDMSENAYENEDEDRDENEDEDRDENEDENEDENGDENEDENEDENRDKNVDKDMEENVDEIVSENVSENVNENMDGNAIDENVNKRETQVKKYHGQHVIVKYEDNYFPGKMTATKLDESGTKLTLVSAMCKSGATNYWKWPEKKDEIWYEPNEIKEIINAPVKKNARGIFSVPEMSRYTDLCGVMDFDYY